MGKSLSKIVSKDEFDQELKDLANNLIIIWKNKVLAHKNIDKHKILSKNEDVASRTAQSASEGFKIDKLPYIPREIQKTE